ncbi:MAG: hypothetical protein ABR586_11040 [Thermoplasmatota archaeon]
MRPFLLCGLAALLLLPQAQAAINGDHPYEATLGYQDGVGADSGSFTVLSGALDAQLPDVRGPYGFFQADAARLTGLTRVCFQATCYTSAGGQLSIVVAQGGAFGIRFPQPTSSEAHAEHALGVLVDFGGKRDLNSFDLGKTLMAPSIGARFAFTRMPAIPATSGTPDVLGAHPDAGGLVALDGKTRIQVLDGTEVKKTFPAGKQDPIAFQGQPALGELHPGLMVLPFEAGATAHLAPAAQGAADAGLDIGRLTNLTGDLNQASKTGTSGQSATLDLGPLKPLLSHLLNGAVLKLPTQGGDGNPIRQVGLVRFDTLDARSDGSVVAVSGAGPVQVQDGEVVDAKPLVGFAIFQMPWWSYLLWAAAIGLFITRIVTKPTAANPAFDRNRWVGLVCTILLFLLFLWLWDLEVKAVWGTSLLSGGGSSGEAFLVLAGLELAPMFAVLFAVVAPLRIILRNGVMVSRGGRMMGLPAAFAYPIGFILGAPLLLAYLNVALKAASGT